MLKGTWNQVVGSHEVVGEGFVCNLTQLNGFNWGLFEFQMLQSVYDKITSQSSGNLQPVERLSCATTHAFMAIMSGLKILRNKPQWK